jgi:glycosyltransferase involved in cell wall biosynthesis
VCTAAFPGFEKCTEETGLLVYRVNGLFSRIPFLYQVKKGRFPPPLKDWLLYRELRLVLENHKPDIIHAQGWIINSLIPALGKDDTPLVMRLADYRAICPAAGMLPDAGLCGMSLSLRCIACSRRLYGRGPLGTAKSVATYITTGRNKSSFNRVNRFIAVSSYVRTVHVEHLGLEESRFVVIPPFYSHEMSSIAGPSELLPEDFILFVGALMPAKGVDVLVEAYRRLNTETRLVMIGIEYPRYDYSLQDSGIILISNPSRDVVLDAYRRCRFVVFPSVWPEPASRVVLEAMAHSKAVVASKIGGLTDILADRETGILVPPQDADALAQAMSYLLDNSQNGVEMGQLGCERGMRLFTPDAVMPQIERVYQSLLTEE